jgi:hypothetical protein
VALFGEGEGVDHGDEITGIEAQSLSQLADVWLGAYAVAKPLNVALVELASIRDGHENPAVEGLRPVPRLAWVAAHQRGATEGEGEMELAAVPARPMAAVGMGTAVLKKAAKIGRQREGKKRRSWRAARCHRLPFLRW